MKEAVNILSEYPQVRANRSIYILKWIKKTYTVKIMSVFKENSLF